MESNKKNQWERAMKLLGSCLEMVTKGSRSVDEWSDHLQTFVFGQLEERIEFVTFDREVQMSDVFDAFEHRDLIFLRRGQAVTYLEKHRPANKKVLIMAPYDVREEWKGQTYSYVAASKTHGVNAKECDNWAKFSPGIRFVGLRRAA